MVDENPASVSRNLHHTEAGYRSQEDFFDSILGKGPGDFDLFGHEDVSELVSQMFEVAGFTIMKNGRPF